MDLNPYAPPQSSITPPSLPSDGDEEIRNKHIKTEATIKSVGTLYYFGVVGLVAGGFLVFSGFSDSNASKSVMGAICIVLSLGQLFLAYGLRRLLPWSRWPTVALSCLGLLVAFPLGTLINAMILVNLLGAKGKMVFSDDYKRIISVTPHIKYKTSAWVVALAVVLIIILIGIIAAIALG